MSVRKWLLVGTGHRHDHAAARCHCGQQIFRLVLAWLQLKQAQMWKTVCREDQCRAIPLMPLGPAVQFSVRAAHSG
ncbi:MAG: hypothetical protein ACJAVT_002303 [Yoonia sp.]|jgi:hypothetical protein